MIDPHEIDFHAGCDDLRESFKRLLGHLAPPARGNFVGVKGAEYIHQSGGGDEAGAVITQRAGNIGTEALEKVGEIIKDAGPQVRIETEAAKGVGSVLRKNVAAQQIAGEGQAADADEKREGPAPATENQMSQPWNGPGEDGDTQPRKTERSAARARFHHHWLGDRRYDNFRCGSFVQIGLGQQRNNFILNRTGDVRFFFVDVHIDFGANAEFRQVDSGLNRKAGMRNDFAVVARFQAVHVGAVAVDILPNAVAGTMHEEFPVTGLANRFAGGAVDFPAANGALFSHCVFYKFNRGVPRIPGYAENLGVGVRHALAQVPDPGDVVVDRAGSV